MTYMYMGVESLTEGLQTEHPVLVQTIHHSEANFRCMQCDKMLTDHPYSLMDNHPVFSLCLPRFAKALLTDKCP